MTAGGPALGARQIGKYILVRRLSVVGAVERYLAEHTGIGRTVEIRCLADGADQEAADSLVREAKIFGGATHRNLQGVVDTGLDEDGRPYAIYESLRGRPLSDILSEETAGFPESRAAMLAVQLMEALRSLHLAGAVLRILAPEFITVEQVSKGGELLKVRAMHGAVLAHEVGDAPLASPGFTPWLAPELRRGAAAVEPSVDIFSAGIIFRQLLTGRTGGDDSELSEGARRTLARACAESKEERFATADAYLQALDLLLPQEGGRPVPISPPPADPLAGDLRWLHLRSSTRHGPADGVEGETRVSLLWVLLTIEAIYRGHGEAVWSQLVDRVEGAETLLPGSVDSSRYQERGVPVSLFTQVLRAADEVIGGGDLGTIPLLGEQVAQRGLRRLCPSLPEPLTPQALSDVLPTLWSALGGDGIAKVLTLKAQSIRLSIRGQATPSLEVAGLLAGVLREAYRMAGATQAATVLLMSEALGDGRDLFGVDWR